MSQEEKNLLLKVNLPMAILGITEGNAIITVYYTDIE